MSKPYDAATKALIRFRPRDWLAFLGFDPTLPVIARDTDLATVSSAADGVYEVGGDASFALHFEWEAGHTGSQLPGRLLAYNVTLSDRLGLPVRSVAVLLTPGADSPALTGVLEKRLPDATLLLGFYYLVVRVWQIAAEQFLAAGLALLPFAPIAKVTAATLPNVVCRVEARLEEAVTFAMGAKRASNWCAKKGTRRGARRGNVLSSCVSGGSGLGSRILA